MVTPTPAVVHPWVGDAASGVRFGIETVAFAPWPVLRAFAQAVEALGFDSLWLSDHPMMAGSATWTHLAALAEATRRVRLGPLVACASYANPVLIARAIADIDLISSGRALLGLGSGNVPPEFAQLGLPWPTASERLTTLEDAPQIIGPLLRGQTITIGSGQFQPHGAVLLPPPTQQPHVPILVGGGGEQTTLRLAARYADASNLGTLSRAAVPLTPDLIVRKLTVLDEHLAAIGRPSNSVLSTGLLAVFLSTDPAAAHAKQSALPPEMAALFAAIPFILAPEDALQQIRAMLASGIQYVIFVVIPGDEETLRILAERVLPHATATVGDDRPPGDHGASS